MSHALDDSRDAAIDACMADVRDLLARHGVTDESLGAIGARLHQLAQTPGLIPDDELTTMHGTDSTAMVLRSEGMDAPTLVLAKFSPLSETPVHDHNTWAAACVVSGRDRYRHWERRDDGADDAHADVRPLYEKELGPGEIVTWLDPPHDIHSQQGIGGPVWELILFGRNAMALPRHYFDPATGAVRVAMPQ